MTDFYETHSQEYHKQTFNVDPSSFLKPLIKYLKPGASILDLGCGSGRDLLWLKNRGFSITGFERSPNLARLARENSGCTVIEGDFCTFDFSSLQFDALLLVGALVHISHAQLAPVFSSISRALNKNGHIYLTLKEGHGQTSHQDGRSFTLWQSKQLEEIFSDLDFSILEFSRQISKVRASDTWLGYLMQQEYQDKNAGD